MESPKPGGPPGETPPQTVLRRQRLGLDRYAAPDPDFEPELYEAWLDVRHQQAED